MTNHSTMRTVAASAFLGIGAWLRPGLKSCASILMYHSIGVNGVSFTVAPEMFERQMRYVVARRYTVLKLSELVARLIRKDAVDNYVVLTFDDGYLDTYQTAFPILKKYQVPASVFVTTGLMGKTLTNSEGVSLPIMSPEHIREMQASGLVEFFPHGETHTKLHLLPPDEVSAEVTISRRVIENVVHMPADLFAYPSGKYSSTVIQTLKRLGFRAAVTVRPGIVRAEADLFTLPRNSVDSSTTFAQFRGKVSRAVDAYRLVKKFLP